MLVFKIYQSAEKCWKVSATVNVDENVIVGIVVIICCYYSNEEKSGFAIMMWKITRYSFTT